MWWRPGPSWFSRQRGLPGRSPRGCASVLCELMEWVPVPFHIHDVMYKQGKGALVYLLFTFLTKCWLWLCAISVREQRWMKWKSNVKTVHHKLPIILSIKEAARHLKGRSPAEGVPVKLLPSLWAPSAPCLQFRGQRLSMGASLSGNEAGGAGWGQAGEIRPHAWGTRGPTEVLKQGSRVMRLVLGDNSLLWKMEQGMEWGGGDVLREPIRRLLPYWTLTQ